MFKQIKLASTLVASITLLFTLTASAQTGTSCQLGLRTTSSGPGLFQPTEFNAGDRIIVIASSVFIRTTPGGELVSFDQTRVAQQGEEGVIASGPTLSEKQNSVLDQSTYMWYDISFDSGKRGWAAAGEVGRNGLSQQFIALKSVACPGGAPGPTPLVFPGTGEGASGGVAIGDDIKIITDGGLNVRNIPGGTKIGATQPRNREGRVVGGPSRFVFGGSSYDWFNIDFDTAPDGWVAGFKLNSAGDIIDQFIQRITRAGSGTTPGSSSTPGYRCFGSFTNNRTTGYSVTEIPNQTPGHDPIPGVALGLSNHQCVVCAPERVEVGQPFKITWATGPDAKTMRWSTGSRGSFFSPNLTNTNEATRLQPLNGELMLIATKPGTGLAVFSSKPQRNDLADECIVPIVTTARAPKKDAGLGANYYCSIYGPKEVRVGEQFEVWYEAGGRTTGLHTQVISPRGWEGPVQIRHGGQFIQKNDPLLNISSNANGSSYGLPMFPCNGTKTSDCTHTVQFTSAGTATLQLEVYDNTGGTDPRAICEYTVKTTQAQPVTPPPPPPTQSSINNPASVTATSLCTSSPRIILSWSPVLGATGYAVHRRPAQDGIVYTQQALVGSITYIDTNGLQTGQEYRYKVSACNASGCSDPTNQPYASVIACGGGTTAPPPPPTSSVSCLNNWNNSTGGYWDGDGSGAQCGCIYFTPNGSQVIGPNNKNPICQPPGISLEASPGGDGTTSPPAELVAICPAGVITKPSASETHAYVTQHILIPTDGREVKLCAFVESPYIPAGIRNSRTIFQWYDESDRGCGSINFKVQQLFGARITKSTEPGFGLPDGSFNYGINPSFLSIVNSPALQEVAANETAHGKYLITASWSKGDPSCNTFWIGWGQKGSDITNLVNQPLSYTENKDETLANVLEGIKAYLQQLQTAL